MLFCAGIREAVCQIELSRMAPPFAVSRKGFNGERSGFVGHIGNYNSRAVEYDTNFDFRMERVNIKTTAHDHRRLKDVER